MLSSTSEIDTKKDNKQTQEKLATVIKTVHTNLRKQCLKGMDPQVVWESHKADQEALETYASAMKELATKHWHIAKETRIDWIHRLITSYFSSDGLLHRLLEKDKRTLVYHTEPRKMPSEELEGDADPHLRCCRSMFENEAEVENHRKDMCQIMKTRQDSNKICLPLAEGIRVLDVGSCYAPFISHPEFDCLAIDLHPASKDVLKCDFIEVSTRLPSNTESSMHDGQKIHFLPSNHFHAVVFSLLLEYMPSHTQRWQCCIKAHKILVQNGVLVIVTPDSNKVHRRVQQMKDWKEAIESLGFQRCCYEKKEHLHCMAFRKISELTDSCNLSEGGMSKNLYIPQDFNTKLPSESSNDEPNSPPTKRKKAV